MLSSGNPAALRAATPPHTGPSWYKRARLMLSAAFFDAERSRACLASDLQRYAPSAPLATSPLRLHAHLSSFMTSPAMLVPLDRLGNRQQPSAQSAKCDAHLQISQVAISQSELSFRGRGAQTPATSMFSAFHCHQAHAKQPSIAQVMPHGSWHQQALTSQCTC